MANKTVDSDAAFKTYVEGLPAYASGTVYMNDDSKYWTFNKQATDKINSMCVNGDDIEFWVYDGTDWITNKIPVVVDNLTTDSAIAALSARQGKVLNEKIDDNEVTIRVPFTASDVVFYNCTGTIVQLPILYRNSDWTRLRIVGSLRINPFTRTSGNPGIYINSGHNFKASMALEVGVCATNPSERSTISVTTDGRIVFNVSETYTNHPSTKLHASYYGTIFYTNG